MGHDYIHPQPTHVLRQHGAARQTSCPELKIDYFMYPVPHNYNKNITNFQDQNTSHYL
jgi:hypothetical protein